MRRYSKSALHPPLKKTPQFSFKKILQSVVGLSFLSASAFGLYWCVQPQNLPIKVVKLVGHKKYLNETKVQQLVTPQLTKNFFKLSVGDLQQRLLTIPWLDEVRVRKVWPNQVVIYFSEHKVAARWDKEGLLSEQGKVFFPKEKRVFKLDLPCLKGPSGKELLVWQQYQLMQKMVVPLHLTITQLILAPRGALQIKLSNGITIILGARDIIARFERFIKAYQKHLSEYQPKIAYVDLRYTSGMSVGWLSEKKQLAN